MPEAPDELDAVERAVHERIAANVRYWRGQRDLTQKQLADELEINLVTLRGIEGARVHPSLSLVTRLAVALDVDIQEIFAPRSMVLRPTGRPPK